MSHELNYNELIMLDALAYYKELSDNFTVKINDDEKSFNSIKDFVLTAVNDNYTTCFNDLISDEKNGMVDILYLVKQNPRLTRLEIVYPVIPDDENTSSVCLVDPIWWI